MASTKIREQITFLSNNHLKLTKQTKQQAQQQDINKQFISTHSRWRRCRNLRCSKISCKSRSPLTDPEPHTFPDVCRTNNRCRFSFRKIVGPRTSRGSSARFWWCLSCKSCSIWIFFAVVHNWIGVTKILPCENTEWTSVAFLATKNLAIRLFHLPSAPSR